MIYVIRLYEVQATDVPTFTAAFDDGPWQRLSSRLNGHLHTGLLVRSTLPPVFLSLAIWQSEEQYLAAEDTAEFRNVDHSLRLLAASYQSKGMFHYRCRRGKNEIQSHSIRIPFALSAQPVRQ
jgi:hypothetical protein